MSYSTLPHIRGHRKSLLIPLTEYHLRSVLRGWVTHYNRGRPHASLGPGIPDQPADLPVTPNKHRHRIPSHCKVVAHPILGGLRGEYCLFSKAACFFANLNTHLMPWFTITSQQSAMIKHTDNGARVRNASETLMRLSDRNNLG